jgi:hypothetical protein
VSPDDDNNALRGRIRDLENTLGLQDFNLAVIFDLTPASANLLGLLLSTRLVTSEVIQQRLQIASDAKVAIHRLRGKLKPFGAEIKSRRLIGYWLSDDTKAKLREVIAKSSGDQTEEAA